MQDQAFKETSEWTLWRQFCGLWEFKVFLIPSWSTCSAPSSSWKYLLVEAALPSVFLLHLWFDPISFWSKKTKKNTTKKNLSPLWTWTWEKSRKFWGTRKSGALQFMVLRRVRHNLATEHHHHLSRPYPFFTAHHRPYSFQNVTQVHRERFLSEFLKLSSSAMDV